MLRQMREGPELLSAKNNIFRDQTLLCILRAELQNAKLLARFRHKAPGARRIESQCLLCSSQEEKKGADDPGERTGAARHIFVGFRFLTLRCKVPYPIRWKRSSEKRNGAKRRFASTPPQLTTSPSWYEPGRPAVRVPWDHPATGYRMHFLNWATKAIKNAFMKSSGKHAI